MFALGRSARPEPLRDEASGAPAAPTIVITGMHRSGTSLIASAFELAGVSIGDRLIGRNESNPRGHFEDVEFQQFHEDVLRGAHTDHLAVTRVGVLEMTPQDVERARALVERRGGRPLWGWKDPRTCLFLDFWHSLLPAPRYVFVYRHPLEVVLSLLRRRMDAEVLEIVGDPLVAVDAWVTYNRALFDFYRRHRDRCVLGHVDALAGDLAGAVASCARRFGIELRSESAFTLYHPEELTRRVLPDEVLGRFARLAPQAAALYRQIDQAADWPQPKLDWLEASFPSSVAAPDEACHGDDPSTYEFELLLTRLEPRTVMAGRRALDELRRHELHVAGERCQELATRCGALEARIAEVMTQHTELAARNATLVTQNATLSDRHARLEDDHARSIRLREEAGRRLAAAQVEMAAERARSAEAALVLADTQSRLASIVRTRAWRAAQKWYAVKRAVTRLFAGGQRE